MLLINAVNAEGRPVELYVKDGKIAAVGQDLAALAGENETVLDAGGLTVNIELICTFIFIRIDGYNYKFLGCCIFVCTDHNIYCCLYRVLIFNFYPFHTRTYKA